VAAESTGPVGEQDQRIRREPLPAPGRHGPDQNVAAWNKNWWPGTCALPEPGCEDSGGRIQAGKLSLNRFGESFGSLRGGFCRTTVAGDGPEPRKRQHAERIRGPDLCHSPSTHRTRPTTLSSTRHDPTAALVSATDPHQQPTGINTARTQHPRNDARSDMRCSRPQKVSDPSRTRPSRPPERCPGRRAAGHKPSAGNIPVTRSTFVTPQPDNTSRTLGRRRQLTNHPRPPTTAPGARAGVSHRCT